MRKNSILRISVSLKCTCSKHEVSTGSVYGETLSYISKVRKRVTWSSIFFLKEDNRTAAINPVLNAIEYVVLRWQTICLHI